MMIMMMIGTISQNNERQKYFNKLILTVNRLRQIFYVYSTRHQVQRYVKSILTSIASLRTNIDSASVSNVNIVGSRRRNIRHRHFAPICIFQALYWSASNSRHIFTVFHRYFRIPLGYPKYSSLF